MEEYMSLIHPFWIRKYGLDNIHGEVKKVPAETLMSPTRFDLFAKYYYIRNRKTSPIKAKRVYYESLRCLVPFGKEYGKEEEKFSFAKHFEVFDSLIKTFSSGEFDPSCSLVPVIAGNHILDGAHRVAALAFFKKDVWICEFASTTRIDYDFDYTFFVSRWMSEYTADLTAFEGMRILKGMAVICLWRDNHEVLPETGRVFYQRSFSLNRREYKRLRSGIEPGWEGAVDEDVRCFNPLFVFLYSPSELEARDSDSITIIIGDDSVRRVSSIVLTREGRKGWRSGGGMLAIVSDFVSSFTSVLITESAYRKYRLKMWLSLWDNKLWISFYGVVSRLWK